MIPVLLILIPLLSGLLTFFFKNEKISQGHGLCFHRLLLWLFR